MRIILRCIVSIVLYKVLPALRMIPVSNNKPMATILVLNIGINWARIWELAEEKPGIDQGIKVDKINQIGNKIDKRLKPTKMLSPLAKV